MARCVSEVGVGFMFAPRYHPAMAIVGPVRKALKVRTAFNILGPMLNPAMAPHALVGVYNQQMVRFWGGGWGVWGLEVWGLRGSGFF